MICRSCKEYEEILSIQKSLVEKDLDINIVFKEYAFLNKDKCTKCENCGSNIYKTEYYLDEESIEAIKNDIKLQIAKKAKRCFYECEDCEHGNFINNLRYDIEKTFDEEGDILDKMLRLTDFETRLGDLVEEISPWDWDKNIENEVFEYISCPNCMSGTGYNYDDKMSYGMWNEDTIVYTARNINDFNENFYGIENPIYDEIKEELHKVADICSYEDIISLKESYIKNPLLIDNTIFKKLKDLLEALYKSGNMYILNEFDVLYRTRINNNEEIYSKDEMWEPPINLIQQGRYNSAGFPILYLGNSKEAVKKEVNKDIDKCYNIGIFKIKKELKCLKINQLFDGSFDGFINEEVQENSVFNEEYIVTNIMSLISKSVGFDGVAYISVKDSQYVNFAILSYERNKDIEIIEIIQEKY
ncbi:hypothetical protein [Clostridioides difficile]|uniref:hypothetical protein n=1 Tax=Clostridioides difficile TaxID=1496 RepID=UPI000D1F593E|nr:hypothetical protein [Clostridioides difficile]HBE9444660.1 hypothetical protein [Clostridioides difficile]